MRYFGKQQSALWCLLALLLPSGCGGVGLECDSSDARNSVVNIVSRDRRNALVNYAAKNSSAVQAKLSSASTDAERSGILSEAVHGASYALGDTIATNSKSRNNRAVSCSGELSATVDDATAQKQVDFKVEKAPDGSISVSVVPFRF
jgi:hypothetical protein